MKKIISLLSLVALTSSCATTKDNVVSAVSSDNVNWPLCVDVISTNNFGVLTLEGMLCASATIELQKLQDEYKALKPNVAFGAVKQVAPSDIKPATK